MWKRGKNVDFPQHRKLNHCCLGLLISVCYWYRKHIAPWSFFQVFKGISLQYSQAPCILPVLELIFFMGCWFPLIVFYWCSALRNQQSEGTSGAKRTAGGCWPAIPAGRTQIPTQSTEASPQVPCWKARGQPILHMGSVGGGEASTQPHVIIPTRMYVCNAAPAATCAPFEPPCTPRNSRGFAHAVPASRGSLFLSTPG